MIGLFLSFLFFCLFFSAVTAVTWARKHLPKHIMAAGTAGSHWLSDVVAAPGTNPVQHAFFLPSEVCCWFKPAKKDS